MIIHRSYLSSGKDVLDGLGYLWSNTISLNQGNCVETLQCKVSTLYPPLRLSIYPIDYSLGFEPAEPPELYRRIVEALTSEPFFPWNLATLSFSAKSVA